MNSENRLEKSNRVACFVPLGAFQPQTSEIEIYQQVSIYISMKMKLRKSFSIDLLL